MKRVDRVSTVLSKSEQIQQLEKSFEVIILPDDVWKIIFEKSSKNKMEKSFQKLACVSKSWSNMITELVRLNFGDYQLSNWVLSHHPNIEILDLSNQREDYVDEDNSTENSQNVDESANTTKSYVIRDESVMLLSNLKELTLNSAITSAGIENLTSLTSLNLSSNNSITNLGMRNLTNLKSISLSNNGKISDVALMNMKCLETLDLTDYGMITNNAIENLTTLTTLQLSGYCMLSNDSILKLTNLTDLMILGYHSHNTGYKVARVNEKAIQTLVNLRKLQVSSKSCGYEGFSKLTNLTSLRLSNFRDYECASSIDAELRCLTGLTLLAISNKEVSNVAIQNLTNLRELSVFSNDKVNDDALKKLSLLTFLRANQGLSDAGIMHLRLLTFLDISDSPNVSDYSLQHLSFLTHLEVNEKISDEGITHLTRLSTLDMSNSKFISDAALQKFSLLTDLTINEDVSDEGIRDLVHLTSLSCDFNFYDSEISDFGIEKLTNLKSIEYNLISRSQITKNGLKLLPKYVKDCFFMR